MKDDAIPVSELLHARECTPQCLLALNHADECCCCCRGRYHGALAESNVTSGASNRWWLDCEAYGLDHEEYADMRSGADDYYKIRRMRIRSNSCFGVVLRFDNSYSVEIEWLNAIPKGYPDDADRLYDLLLSLVAAKRVTAFIAPQGADFIHAHGDDRGKLITYYIEGIKSLEEASVIKHSIDSFIFTPYFGAWDVQTKRVIKFAESNNIDMSLISERLMATKAKWDEIGVRSKLKPNHSVHEPDQFMSAMGSFKTNQGLEIITVKNLKETVHER